MSLKGLTVESVNEGIFCVKWNISAAIVKQIIVLVNIAAILSYPLQNVDEF